MAYEKQIWNQYDDLKTEEENIENGAVVTDNRMNHIEEGIGQTDTSLQSHLADKTNPHGVTKAQVGLSKVDDIQQAAKEDLDSHVKNITNPHQVTSEQVGAYSKAESDSLLKVKANDSEVVHNTGNETISGSKSFEEIKINGKTIIDLLHPVGSYYITNDSTNPSEIFGLGTWVRVNGRVLVGVDEDDSTLSLPNKTGGSTNPLTSHTHDYSRSGANAITTGGTPSVANQIAAVTSGGYFGSTATGILQSTGNNTNHANWQPFQTAYMWYRSA